jgi:AraC-like DNA-binding protein
MSAPASRANEDNLDYPMIAPANDFRKVRFVSPQKPDRRWLDWYREEFGRHFSRLNYEVAPGSALGLEHVVRVLPGVAVFYGHTSPMRITNLPHRAADDDIVLLLPSDNAMSVSVRNSDVALDPHGGAIVANDLPTLVDIGQSYDLMSVRLSRRSLAALVPNLSDLPGRSVPAASQPLQLLRNYVRSLDAIETIATPEAAHLAATHLRDLAALAIGATRDGTAEAQSGARAARLAAVKADIVANIASRDVTIDKVAARQRISPRYIGALFAAEDTTFTDFVLEQRLALTHRRLCDPRFSHQSISTVAYDSGFGDLSHFNHAFRRRYDATPSQVRAMRQLAS